MSGRPRLTDFGLTILDSRTWSSRGQGPSIRWMSPELFDPEMFGLKDRHPTRSSDCYALGMVIYEVLSGRVPFTRHNKYLAIAKILRGQRPERPQGAEGKRFTDNVWRILEGCWQPKPDCRSSSRDVLIRWRRLEEVSGTPPSPLMAEDSQSPSQDASAKRPCG
jgi:hypothetical protein